jgi:hypothetical protein
MFEPRPPRREPRVFLVKRVHLHLAYIVIDAWDLHGIGKLPNVPPELRSVTFTRRLLQVRPTVVLTLGLQARTEREFRAVCDRLRLPVLHLDRAATTNLSSMVPGVEMAFQAYPIARALDPRLVSILLPLAMAALHGLSFPHRAYVPRQPSFPSTGLDA